MRIAMILFLPLAGLLQSLAPAAEWQWSVPDGQARAYLWIPFNCQRVRAVLLANHNMIEQGILEHPIMRQTLTQLGIAEAWVVPAMDGTFDFNKGAGDHFNSLIKALADESGYSEIQFVPVIPIGHSACASYPWNFAAWSPGRTLAILSVHGDAPQTTRTGNGKPKVDWGDHNIDGVPGLMVMGEYEWGEDRLAPALDFLSKHPAAPLAFLADAGHGHFDYSDSLVSFLAMFIRKAADKRLPSPSSGQALSTSSGQADALLDWPARLRPVDGRQGWRIDRWRKDQPPISPAASVDTYAGDPKQSFWCFDEEIAQATERYYAAARGKKPQLVYVTDGQMPPEKGSGEPVVPQFIPLDDQISFRLTSGFLDAVPGDAKNTNPARWTGLPVGAPLGHANGGGHIVLSKIVGPVVKTGTDTFRIALDRSVYTADRRNNDMWLLATHYGDAEFKSAVQQVLVHAVPNTHGTVQHLTFQKVEDQAEGVKSVKLEATSDASLPVSYYVREGPAEVEGDTLRFLPIPPRSRSPVKVTVVAWQWGRAADPIVQTATPVEMTFSIVRR